MVGFSRYLNPDGEHRDADQALRGTALDAGTTTTPSTGIINERGFAATLPPVDDNLLPTRRRGGQLLAGLVPGGRS